MKYLFYSLLIGAALLEVAADVLFKKWALQNGKIIFLGAFAIYLIGTVLWAFSLKFGYLSKAVALFTILNSILVIFAGVIIFKEHLSLASKIGIALGIISIALLQF